MYLPKHIATAYAHVRAGGHSVIRRPRGWQAILPCTPDGTLPELSAWALLDLGVAVTDVPTDGPAAGLAVVTLPARLRDLVTRWCERDSAVATDTLTEVLDCRACAACCRRNRVVLEAPDLARWRDAGRKDLTAHPYVRTARGTTLLRVLRGGDCMHLRGNDCGIYALRPDNCRDFPAGSEPCLGARDEAAGLG